MSLMNYSKDNTDYKQLFNTYKINMILATSERVHH